MVGVKIRPYLRPIFIVLVFSRSCILAENENKNEFCNINSSDSCAEVKEGCLQYDKERFKTTPSLLTYFPEGRLGNKISAFLTLLFMKLEFGHDVYYEKESYQVLDYLFQNVKGKLKILEEDLCDWKQFGFTKYEGNIELLGNPEWAFGKAIRIFLAPENFMRQDIQGGVHYIQDYRQESLEALTLRKTFIDHSLRVLTEVAQKVGKKPAEITYVGIHSRRTDYLEFRKKTLGLKNIYKDYFLDAMDYFNTEYTNVAFLYVSDDMAWGRKKLKEADNLFFVGCGDGDDFDCIGKDFAILRYCNHTITSQGSFGTWAGIFAGGEIYTEYGSLIQ